MRIDVHAHLWTDGYLDLIARHGKTDTATQRGLGAGTTEAELDARFEMMDAAGVDRQVLSAAPQLPHFHDEDTAVEAARRVNDLYAELVRRYPQRFAAFASLPLPHVDAALEELERALNELGMVGVAVNTSILGRPVADPTFAPLLEELDRRRATLSIHPAGCSAESPLIRDQGLTWMIGAPIEDAISVVQLIKNRVPMRYPGLKIVNSHLGGGLPLFVRRLDDHRRWEAPDAPEPLSVSAQRMWYDTVSHGHIPALRCAVESLGADRLVLGTDFPYVTGPDFELAVEHIGSAGLTRDDVDRIQGRNAAAVLEIGDAPSVG